MRPLTLEACISTKKCQPLALIQIKIHIWDLLHWRRLHFQSQMIRMTGNFTIVEIGFLSLAISPVVVVVSQFNGTSTPKGSYSDKTGDNDCNVNSSRYSLSTALCESNSISGQVWTKCPTRHDTLEAALMHLLYHWRLHWWWQPAKDDWCQNHHPCMQTETLDNPGRTLYTKHGEVYAIKSHFFSFLLFWN